MHRERSERCDIVIPVWNNLELTRDCVESIKKHTSFPYRIVIVDNASDAPTREYLEALAAQKDESVAVIRNTENRGFIKAVNQGMQYSNAAYVCIMNNDTVTTDAWLGEMIDILRQNPGIGLINPSSNTSCQFPGSLSIDDYAQKLKTFKGKYQELYTCRAFAMVVRRDVIDRVGYLDEKYGMGYYDDTDYCKRTQKLGYMTVRAKASYVYHRERRSFSMVKERSDILLENEKMFAAEWGKRLRIAYVLADPGSPSNINRISSNINRMAKIGYEVWIFTRARVKPRLALIDHESIRFYCYPAFLFDVTCFYKIWKRKKKKKLHAVLTQNARLSRLFKFFGNTLAAEIFEDRDFPEIEKKLNELSRVTT